MSNPRRIAPRSDADAASRDIAGLWDGRAQMTPEQYVFVVRLGSRHLAPVVVLVGSGIVVIVATLLPWASRENRATEVTTEFGAGAVGFVLVALVLVAILCALSGASARNATLQNLAWAFAAACVVTAVALALTRIKAANDAAMTSVGVGNLTSYEVGAVLGILGSAALLVGCLILRSCSQRDPHDSAMTEPQGSA